MAVGAVTTIAGVVGIQEMDMNPETGVIAAVAIARGAGAGEIRRLQARVMGWRKKDGLLEFSFGYSGVRAD